MRFEKIYRKMSLISRLRFTKGVMEEDLIEFIAERDEELIRTLYGIRL